VENNLKREIGNWNLAPPSWTDKTL